MDITNLHDLLLGHLFPWVPKVASLWHWVTGFIIFISIVKLIVGAILRAYLIYRERGIGWWMVGALWGTVFTILRTPFTIAQAAVDAAVAPLDDHQDQGPHGGHGGHGGAGAGGVAVLGVEASPAGAKAPPPAYQAGLARQASTPYAAARGPDLDKDLADSDIRLPGAPCRHCPRSAATSAASFPRDTSRDSVIPEMPPEMELLPRLPWGSTASDNVRAKAAAARASAIGQGQELFAPQG